MSIAYEFKVLDVCRQDIIDRTDYLVYGRPLASRISLGDAVHHVIYIVGLRIGIASHVISPAPAIDNLVGSRGSRRNEDVIPIQPVDRTPPFNPIIQGIAISLCNRESAD